MSATIVVGIDWSDNAVKALRWAVAEAELRGARLRVVHSWSLPYVVNPLGLPMAAAGNEDLEVAAKAVLNDTIDKAVGSGTSVQIEPVLIESHPVEALMRAAKGADLLVVGSRGRGGFKGLLLGSVSQSLVQHAPCPVVVVPSD